MTVPQTETHPLVVLAAQALRPAERAHPDRDFVLPPEGERALCQKLLERAGEEKEVAAAFEELLLFASYLRQRAQSPKAAETIEGIVLPANDPACAQGREDLASLRERLSAIASGKASGVRSDDFEE